jgi:hypothetical protein
MAILTVKSIAKALLIDHFAGGHPAFGFYPFSVSVRN